MPTSKKPITKKPVRKTAAHATTKRTSRRTPVRTAGFERKNIAVTIGATLIVFVVGFTAYALYTKLSASASSSTTSSSNLTTIINNAGSAKTLTLAAGNYTFSNFSQFLDPAYVGVVVPATMTSFTGAGSANTTLYMIAGTSTKASVVPTTAGDTNPLGLIRFNGAASSTIGGFTLKGTNQGHLYNGMALYKLSSPKVSNIIVSGIPGNDHEPPGETFGINSYKTTNGTFTNIEVNGLNNAASGFGSNGSTNTTIKSSYFHQNYYGIGATFYKDTNVTITSTKSSGNRTNLNFEETSGTITLTNDTFGTANKGDDMYIGNTTTSAKFVINDPVLSGGQSKLRIHIPAIYQTVTNKQKASDVKVYVNGVDKTSTAATIYQ